MDLFDEKIGLCALNRIFGYTPVKGFALYSYAGSAAAIFGLDKGELRQMIGAAKADLVTDQALEQAARELERLEKSGYSFVSIADEGYPALLKECPDPPLGLYLRSRSEAHRIFGTRPAVAVVGTRSLTPYGAQWCRQIVAAMAQAKVKPLIVSGLAFGTDIVAHTAAMEAGLPTAGVMATGIETVYPCRHRPIAEKMASSEGSALVTDYPPGTAPVAYNFMRRNRIIAGLSRAVILIESRIRGGGMITAKYASDYERDLYVLPGRVDDPCSQGCNLLLRNKVAEPISDLEDLMHKLNLGYGGNPRNEDLKHRAALRFGPGEKTEQIVGTLMAIRQHRGITADELCDRLDLPYSRISEHLVLLETEGFISVDLLQRCSVNAKFVYE